VTNVLLAIDGSLYGKIISDFVVNHHWSPNTHLKLINLIEPMADDVYSAAQFERQSIISAKALLQETAMLIQRSLPKLDLSQIIRHGEPIEEILREATEWPADLIVLGSHGRRNANRASLGSVSHSVLTQAQSTVIVVRVPQKKLEGLAVESEKTTVKYNSLKRVKLCVK
jgi:nucleotide-binding universal stress UspA family protein